MSLNPRKVPPRLRPVLSVSDKWAFTDDGYRGEAIAQAATDELEAFVRVFDTVLDEDFEWIATEAEQGRVTAELDALICLEMAVHLAVVELRNRRKK
jgi:hypothetical protein